MKLKITDIKTNPNNPRLIKDDKFKKLVQSLKDFPEMADVREIVVNKDHVVLGGNMRLKAMQEAGWTEAPVKVVDWSQDKQDEFVVKDNASFGEWDWDELANQYEVAELIEWGVDLPDSLLPEAEIEEDEAPEVSSDPAVSKLGEIYQLGRHRVMCGDSTDPNQVQKLMNDKIASFVFTDPPYGINFQSNMRTKTAKFDVLANDDVIDIGGVTAVSVYSEGWILICTSWKVLKKWLIALEHWGEPNNIIIWDKGGGGIGDLKHSLLTDYEIILAYNRGAEIVGKRIGSVWDCGKDSSSSYQHPTQKPVSLPTLALNTFSNKEDRVLDVYLGSGSTLIACEQTDRTCYGMELDPKYVDVIRKRYAKFTNDNELPDNWEGLTPVISDDKQTEDK